MIALDTNFLVAALVRDANGHDRVAEWLGGVDERLVTTSVNLAETLRVVSHPRVFLRPATLTRATRALRGLMKDLEVHELEEPSDWLLQLEALASNRKLADMRGNDVFDARIAITLRHNGVKRLCSLDSDFDRFDFLEREPF